MKDTWPTFTGNRNNDNRSFFSHLFTFSHCGEVVSQTDDSLKGKYPHLAPSSSCFWKVIIQEDFQDPYFHSSLSPSTVDRRFVGSLLPHPQEKIDLLITFIIQKRGDCVVYLWSMVKCIFPFYKGECSNYMGISLFTVPGKFYGMLVIDRVVVLTDYDMGGTTWFQEAEDV